jgi:hypothetical protein
MLSLKLGHPIVLIDKGHNLSLRCLHIPRRLIKNKLILHTYRELLGEFGQVTVIK